MRGIPDVPPLVDHEGLEERPAHVTGALAEPALGEELGGVAAIETERGVRRRAAQQAAPALAEGMAAAVDDHALAPDRHLEGERTGVGRTVEPGGRGPSAVGHQHAAPGLEPLKARLGRCVEGPRAPTRALQQQVEVPGRPLQPAVEERQAAVAVAQQPQEGAHALDRQGQLSGRLFPGGVEQGAQVDQVAQHRHLGEGVALGLPAVQQHLTLQLLLQKRAGARQQGLPARQGERRKAETLDRGQQVGAGEPRGQHLGEVARLTAQRIDQGGLEGPLGIGGVVFEVTQDVGQPPPQHLRRPGEAVPAARVVRQPERGQIARLAAGLIAARAAQVAQPVESVQPLLPVARRLGRGPERLRVLQVLAGQEVTVGEKGAPGLQVARPDVAVTEDERRAVTAGKRLAGAGQAQEGDAQAVAQTLEKQAFGQEAPASGLAARADIRGL